MAGVGECFSIGSTVSCTTCFKQVIEGDVLAFDPSTKMLILKCTKSGKQLNDVFIVNLGLCSDVQVKNETNSSSQVPPSLNLQRLNNRVRNSVEDKRRWVAAMQAGVSPEGQKLFLAISKTINEVAWKGSNIVVFNDVIIRPPYRLENVSGQQGSKQLNYVRKIVERLTKDRPGNSHHSMTLMQSQPLPQRRNSNGNGPSSSSSSTSTSTSTLNNTPSTKITERNTNTNPNSNIKAN